MRARRTKLAGGHDLGAPSTTCSSAGLRSVLYSLVVTAKLNDIDPKAWLADVLACIAKHPARTIDGLPPWNWRAGAGRLAA